MKQTLKKLLLVVLALIVVFAYTKITGTEGGSSAVPAQNSSGLTVLPEADDSPAEAPDEDEAPADSEEAEEPEDTSEEEPAPSEAQPEEQAEPEELPAAEEPAIDEDGVYTTKEDVALYIHTYGKLPSNFITKKEAEGI